MRGLQGLPHPPPVPSFPVSAVPDFLAPFFFPSTFLPLLTTANQGNGSDFCHFPPFRARSTQDLHQPEEGMEKRMVRPQSHPHPHPRRALSWGQWPCSTPVETAPRSGAGVKKTRIISDTLPRPWQGHACGTNPPNAPQQRIPIELYRTPLLYRAHVDESAWGGGVRCGIHLPSGIEGENYGD